jgi:glycosyltransferase involved in cell wall biosynthesis
MNMQQEKPLTTAWFTWEVQPRNRSMSQLLNVPLYELTSKKHRAIKYALLCCKTIAIIHKNKIDVIFAQNPSIVLSALAIAYKFIFNKIVIIDAHNGGLLPLEGKYKMLNYLAKVIAKRADTTIVSNKYLAELVTSWGGTPYVMPDPLPTPHKPIKTHFNDSNYFLFICTWASDVPYDQVIEAARLCSNEKIYITGNYQKKLTLKQITDLPKNVKLLGFVSEEDYLDYFTHAAAAIDLTTRNNCLVCGAYEAAALGVPAILSDTQVSREVFTQGYIFTNNSTQAIATAINQMRENRQQLQEDIQVFNKNHHNLTIKLATKLKQNFGIL